jgi:hypothetical protein
MSAQGLDPGFHLVVRKLLIDRLTVEIAGAFQTEGIETLVLKGPALAEWLYPGEVRTYCDSDLMVAPENRPLAVSVLERLGFRSWVLSPLSVDPGGTAFQRGHDMVDLHCVLPGLDGDPGMIWASFLASSERQVIGAAELRVPDRATLLLHVCLHAAHHANFVECKPFEDLRRAFACTETQQWMQALELAHAYEGMTAFAVGLRLLPEGRDLAKRLGLAEVSSFRYRLRREDNAIAEEISALLLTKVGVRQKLATVLGELFPQPEYMRGWSPMARRGRLGLAAAYLWRPLWAVEQVPGAIRTLWRVRQKTGREPDA